jgi:GTP pyrophosphokinase
MWLQNYNRAILLATKAHDGQRRKFVDEPYILHPLRVADDLFARTGNIKLATAGVLHDVIEDTDVTSGTIRLYFGSDMTELVMGVTKVKSLPKAEKEAEYFARFARLSRDGVLLKLADRCDNTRDFKLKPVKFTKGYRSNTETLLSKIPDHCRADSAVLTYVSQIRLNMEE